MKPIPGFDGYFATEEGFVVGRKGRRLNGWVDPDGYARVKVPVGATFKPRGVHQLVCLAFHGSADEDRQVRHLDGNPANNVPGNSSWGTRRDNSGDRRVYGIRMSYRGEMHHSAKLTRADVAAIRALAAGSQLLQREIGSRFGVTQATIGRILNQKIWRV